MGVLDTNQVNFVVGVSKATGIDPRVIIAWMKAEGAYTKGGTGGYNYLNIRPFAGDKHINTSSAGFSQFGNEQDAIAATVSVLNQPNMRMITSTAKTKPTPKQQIAAIAASPWDANHYGGNGGVNLQNTFAQLFKGGLNDQYQSPANAKSIATDFQANAADWTSIDMNTVGNAASDAATAVENAVLGPVQELGKIFNWIGGNWDRIFFVVGGAILVIIGLVMLGKSGNNTFTFARGDE